MKKTLSLLLAAVMLLISCSSIPFVASAAFPVPAVILSKKGTKPESIDVIQNTNPCFDISSTSGSISAYAVDTAYNTSSFIRGVSWYDITESVYLNEDSVFKTGHSYTLKVRVSCKDNFEFYSNNEGLSISCELFTNGQYVSCSAEEVVPKQTINVVNSYVCSGITEIDSVYISGIQAPQSGKAPSTLSIIDSSKGFELDSEEDAQYIDNKIMWTCVTETGETVLTKDDLFEKDKQYRAYIRLKAKAGYEFKTESETKSAVTASLGGRECSVVSTGDKALSEYITVYNTEPYICSEDPDINLKIDVSRCNVTELESDHTYNGSAQSADIIVELGSRQLTEGSDYEIVYSGNRTDAGEVNYEIQGIGIYGGSISKSFVIKPLKVTPSVKLSATKYTYNGKDRKPTVTVTANKKTLKNKTDYTVSYSKTCKNVGSYNVTVTLKGNYSGSKKAKYTIVPKGTTLSSKKTCKKNSITVNWTKQATQTTGYEIEYSTSSKFTGSKKVKITKTSTVSKKITGLKNNKKYYFRIRTYKKLTSNGKTEYFYSSCSSSKTFKTTKK